MNCLLDTQVLIWTLMEPDRLSLVARSLIEDHSIAKHVSPVSFFEMSIKISIGKLSLKGVDIDDLPELLYERGVELIVVEPFETVALRRLPLKKNHRDPFDRLLICQAIARNLTLISSDTKIAQYRKNGLSLIW